MSTLWMDYNYKDKLYWTIATKFKGDNNLVIDITENIMDYVARLREARLQWVVFEKVVFTQPFVVEDEARLLKKYLIQTKASYTLLRMKSQWQHEAVIDKYKKELYSGRLLISKES